MGPCEGEESREVDVDVDGTGEYAELFGGDVTVVDGSVAVIERPLRVDTMCTGGKRGVSKLIMTLLGAKRAVEGGARAQHTPNGTTIAVSTSLNHNSKDHPDPRSSIPSRRSKMCPLGSAWTDGWASSTLTGFVSPPSSPPNLYRLQHGPSLRSPDPMG